MKSRIVLATASLLLTRQLVAADCNVSSNYTIINSPDSLDSISSCTEVDGSISLLLEDKPSAWDSDETTVDLGDLESISGDLVIYPDDKPKKSSISGPSLKTIEGGLTISNNNPSSTIPNLEISFPALEKVGSNYVITGPISKVSIEHGEGLEVGKMMRIYSLGVEELVMGGLYMVDGDFSVDSNDDLKDLTLGSLTIVEKGFSVQENSALETVSFPKLKIVGGDLAFYHNAKLTKVEFPALESAATISMTSNGDSPSYLFPRLSSLGNSNTTSTSNFEDVSEIEFASLRNVTGSLNFQSTAVEELVIPLLKSMDGDITVQDNSAMTTFALPRVKSIGDITIKGNDKLTNFTANALKSAGTISIKGSFTDVEFFGLEEVTGDFKVVGDDSMDCSWFEDNVKQIVKGSYTCVGSHEKKERKSSTGGIENTEGNPEDYITSDGGDDNGDGGSKSGSKSDDDDSSDSGKESDSDKSSNDKGSSGSKGLSNGATAGIGVGVALGVVLILAGVFFFVWRRRKTNDQTPGSAEQSRPGSEDAFDAQRLGVHTKIEANSATNSAPSLGTLDFSRNSFLEASAAGSEKELGPWKTIRRVSDSTSGASAEGVKS
ncbi:Fc.00g083000.m01.CDS01 [Cosmosporella sp. VM-42]